MCPQAKLQLPERDEALTGRLEKMPVAESHFVLGNPLGPPYPEGMELALFGMGCFWGAERKFWKSTGVFTTAVGYAAGYTPNPTYQEVCRGRTGHNEVVRVVFDPQATTYERMLKVFWENHDPTQGMRQGNDFGTQYRSGIYACSDVQSRLAESSRSDYQKLLDGAGYGPITRVLLRRGLPPAVSGEEPAWILWHGRHRCVLSHRLERRRGRLRSISQPNRSLGT